VCQEGRHLKPGPPEYETELVITGPLFFLFNLNQQSEFTFYKLML
jgi:hypothetical protein